MKVLQIINSHSDTVGGAERLAVQLHQGSLQKGIDSHLLCLMKAPANRRDKTYSLRFNTPYHPAVLLRLIGFLRQPRWRDTEVIHVHLFPAQLLVALAIRLVGLRAQLVTTEHNTFNRRRKIPGARIVDSFYYGFYQKVVCISDATAQTMLDWIPALKEKLVVITNGIEVSRYANENGGGSSKDGAPLIILSAGRLTEQKNYATSLQAIDQLLDLPCEYWIAGQGELEDELRAQTERLGLSERVRFLGFRDDLPALLEQADVFLSSSRWEGFGLSVAEAMAAGVPVVVSDVPGVTEVVGPDSGCGTFADPSEPNEFAARLRALLEDPQARREMGQRGRERARRFDVKVMIDRYIALYEEVLAEQNASLQEVVQQ